MRQTIINVSNRLPVTLTEEGIQKSSGGLVTALEGVSAGRFELKWIGWPGGGISEPQRQKEMESLLTRDYGYTPVFLTEEQIEGFYEGLSNSSIWPLMHYMPNYMRYEAQWWDDYVAVNRLYADAVLSVARPGDMVWVHDYQLMLLPEMLRQAQSSLRIGFFLHTPFPSYEIFRCHPHRVELISGLLGANQIGFHTFGYLRHFRSAVLRILGIESELTRIRHEGHISHLGVYPIGINARKFEEEIDSPAHAEQVEAFRQNYAHKRIILSVERMDYTKGILHRLDAIDLFLRDCAFIDEMKFIFISVPSREKVEEYQELLAEVESRIGRLNGKYATVNNSPIHFIHGSVTFTELCALYALAEVAMVTPLIDGMNLVAKEYVAAQREGSGVLMLSEFAGAAEELFNAEIVNPYDAQGVARALRSVLDWPMDQRRERMAPMRERVMKYDAGAWAGSFVQDLSTREPDVDAISDIHDAADRVAAARAGDQPLALFLDYDGTLREIVRDPAAAKPTPEGRALLDALVRAPGLDVTIVSGRTTADLETFLGDYPFGMVAEHGAMLRRPGEKEWEQLDRNVNYSWKRELMPLLKHYEASTPGSRIEEKRTSLVWHYRQADPEFGQHKAMNLADELSTLVANDPVQIRHGRKIVEVAAASINKGAAVSRVLEERSYAVILCAGDDTTDESMFRLDLPNMVSIKIGRGDTQATYRLASPAALRSFLWDSLRLGNR